MFTPIRAQKHTHACQHKSVHTYTSSHPPCPHSFVFMDAPTRWHSPLHCKSAVTIKIHERLQDILILFALVPKGAPRAARHFQIHVKEQVLPRAFARLSKRHPFRSPAVHASRSHFSSKSESTHTRTRARQWHRGILILRLELRALCLRLEQPGSAVQAPPALVLAHLPSGPQRERRVSQARTAAAAAAPRTAGSAAGVRRARRTHLPAGPVPAALRLEPAHCRLLYPLHALLRQQERRAQVGHGDLAAAAQRLGCNAALRRPKVRDGSRHAGPGSAALRGPAVPGGDSISVACRLSRSSRTCHVTGP